MREWRESIIICSRCIPVVPHKKTFNISQVSELFFLASPRPPDNIKPGIHFISIVTMYCILNFSNLSIKELNFSVINILERCFFSNKEVILFMLTAKKHPTSTYWVSYHNNQHFRLFSPGSFQYSPSPASPSASLDRKQCKGALGHNSS